MLFINDGTHIQYLCHSLLQGLCFKPSLRILASFTTLRNDTFNIQSSHLYILGPELHVQLPCNHLVACAAVLFDQGLHSVEVLRYDGFMINRFENGAKDEAWQIAGIAQVKDSTSVVTSVVWGLERKFLYPVFLTSPS